MGQNSQKRAEKNRRRLEKRRRELERSKKRQIQELHLKPELRVNERVPVAWIGELPEDVAVFDDSVRQTLSGELEEQASAVLTSLEEVCSGIESGSQERLANIPRKSPYSDWRLLIRGLVAWNRGQLDEAKSVWERLDQSRRPWRIAAALMLAKRDDLTEIKLKGPEELGKVEDPWVANADGDLLLSAKVTRQVFVERIALRAAYGLLRIELPEENSDDEDDFDFLDFDDDDGDKVSLGPEHFKFLHDFSVKYAPVEPELVRALQCGFIKLAMKAEDSEVFQFAVSKIQGPSCDPRNNLIRFLGYVQMDPTAALKAAKEYLDTDLSSMIWYTAEVRAALWSTVHCLLAGAEMSRLTELMMAFFYRVEDQQRSVMKAAQHFENAIKEYPKNRVAYEGYVHLFELQLQDSSLTKAKRKKLEEGRAGVWNKRLEHLPNDVEIRVKLVEYLMEYQKSEQAREHIELLKGTRSENPLHDCMYWRWHFQEIGRLCSKKNTVTKSVPLLSDLEKLWPKWLPNTWLPYLKAAVDLRMGDLAAFDKIPNENRPTSALTEACMKLGAAQHASVPAPELKVLRETVEGFLTEVKSLSDEDLFSAASFFWDVTRAEIRYPSCAQHAPKFLKQLSGRASLEKRLKSAQDKDMEVRSALLVMAIEKVFTARAQFKPPRWLMRAAETGNVTALATVLTGMSHDKWRSNDKDLQLARLLSTKIERMSDPFYRPYFQNLVKQTEDNARSDVMRQF